MSDDDSTSRFDGTEEYYAEYRPDYGERVVRYLEDRFELDESASVLDLGCGTGQLAIPLAARVGEVVGMDPNEEMLREARRKAREAGVENVEWVVGSDADLREGLWSDLGTVRLTTMGRSFHWMQQGATLDCVHRMTEPGGGVATVADTEWLTRGVEDWEAAAYDVADEYLDDLPERTGPVEEYDDPWDELLEARGFADVEVRTLRVEREWTIDEAVGYVFSLSFCSPERFGDEKDAFEADLRERLRERRDERDDRTFSQTAEIDVTSGRA
ncbi:class I SAM-dependent methyltransferase [Halorussus sp. MSC15.2]|uniref:class I SAM-dependent methyltransferase n=1 Tax=Halorussus sp. MSC15.2 TaxID=2283638 RepID=UPI0013D2E321|nr:class I SAM-dependent methyltransferase [Halorussus sp. MSC15.2]NEU58351.1 class I SAM-dependent methyltransferase [Halorussus sp. MSC15.2]